LVTREGEGVKEFSQAGSGTKLFLSQNIHCQVFVNFYEAMIIYKYIHMGQIDPLTQ